MKAFSKKVLRTMLLLCLVAAPLIFLAAEPPLAVYYQGRISGAALCGAAFLFLALCYAIYRWAKSRIAFSAACLVMYAFPAAVILITCFAPPGPNSVTDFWRFLVLFLWGAAAVSFYCGAGERLIWPGLFGLVLVLSSLYAVELALRAVPVDVFSKQILSVPSFADMTQLPPPRKEPVRAPGRICADSARTPVRILVVGGAASAGEPLLAPSLSYVFHLQRLLDERRPGECFEVLSAAVAGAGAVDVLHQMQQQPSPPADIVLVESGRENLEQRALNGSSAILSDREMHQRRMFFERLSRVPGYLTWRRTRSFAVLRYYLLALRDGIAKTISGPALKTKYRVSSADFGWALREAARYGARNDLRIVFVDVFSSGQPKGRSLARPDDHAAALVRAAKAYDIPLVSLETNSTPAQKREMFCGPHLLNAAGHRFLAQQLYDVFFAPQTASYWTALWQRKNIDPARKPLGKEIRLALGALDTAQSEIRIRATAPFLTVEKALLAARVDYGALHILGVIGKDEQVFTASREMLGVLRPIGEIGLRLERSASGGLKCVPVGTDGRCFPAHLHVISGGGTAGARVYAAVDGLRADPDASGYNVVVVEPRFGEVIASACFNPQNSEAVGQTLDAFLHELGRNAPAGQEPLIIVAVKSDGGQNVKRRELAEAFRYIGGTGTIPRPYESFVLLGFPGAAPGTALEKTGRELIDIQLGSPALRTAYLLYAERE